MHNKIPKQLAAKITVDANGCWIFKGSSPSSNGYERCWLWGTRWQAHRIIYELITGKDIRQFQLDHTCEVRQCCNPAHLDPVTPSVNNKRKFRRRKRPEGFQSSRKILDIVNENHKETTESTNCSPA